MLGMVLLSGAERSIIILFRVFPGCDTEWADAEVRKRRMSKWADQESFFNLKQAVD